MQLSFKHPHLSILAFPDIELPPFAVIVGLNGSGKSHLLQAIANGRVSNSAVATQPDFPGNANPSIKLLGQDGRVLDFGQAYAPQGPVDSAAMMMGSYEQLRLELVAVPRAALEDAANHKIAEIIAAGRRCLAARGC